MQRQQCEVVRGAIIFSPCVFTTDEGEAEYYLIALGSHSRWAYATDNSTIIDFHTYDQAVTRPNQWGQNHVIRWEATGCKVEPDDCIIRLKEFMRYIQDQSLIHLEALLEKCG